jgi:drug/metabolite transporter (DMT)-like permease
VSLYLSLIQGFGAPAAVSVGIFRKALTLAISFIAAPKPFSVYYILGGILVFLGLVLSQYAKGMSKKPR